MCTVSMIADYYMDKYQPLYNLHLPIKHASNIQLYNRVRNEIKDLGEILRIAKIYDKRHDEPNCEVTTKLDFLRSVAHMVDINLDDYLNKEINEKPIIKPHK